MGSGTSSSSSDGPPWATSVSPSRTSTRPSSRATSIGVSSGGGERSDTSTTSLSTSCATRPQV
jgi:hypothetical protein